MDLSLSEAKHKGLTKLLVETENTFLFPWCCALPLLRAGERQSVSSSDCWVLMKVRQVARVVFISLIFFDDCTDDGSLVATTILSELHLFLSLSFQELLHLDDAIIWLPLPRQLAPGQERQDIPEGL